jgi:hypothetical protein
MIILYIIKLIIFKNIVHIISIHKRKINIVVVSDILLVIVRYNVHYKFDILQQ